MANVIEIEHLTYSYPGASQQTLKDISIQIEQGDFLAIVGNNGCGKSTFCKTRNGLIPQFISGSFEGTVLACGLDTKRTEVGLLAHKVGYLIYQVKIIMQAFYPLMLNTAKRSRTTVVVLEIKGYRYAAVNKEVKKIKLSSLKVGNNDLMFLSLSFLWVAVTVLISTMN